MANRSAGEGHIRERKDERYEGTVMRNRKRYSVYGKTAKEARESSKSWSSNWSADKT